MKGLKASELIVQLQKAIEKFGDRHVITWDFCSIMKVEDELVELVDGEFIELITEYQGGKKNGGRNNEKRGHRIPKSHAEIGA